MTTHELDHDHDCPWRAEALALRVEVEDLKSRLAATEAKLAATEAKLAQTTELLQLALTKLGEYEREIKQLKDRLLGRTSEKRSRPEDKTKVARAKNDEAAQQKRKSRREERAELPLEIVEHPLDGDRRERCPACGEAMLEPLPADVSTEIEYVPGHVVRREHRRETRRCPVCHHFERAAAPTRVWDKAPYGPGFCAHTIVSKCDDGLPQHRQAARFEREGVPIARSTLVELFHRCAGLVEPIYTELQCLVAADRVVYADETSLKQQRTQKLGFVWTFACNKAITYVFSPDRSGETPQRVLGDSQGFLVVDGYTGYNAVTTPARRIRAGCTAHARRKFVDVEDPLATQIIDLFDVVFAVEREAATRGILATDEHRALRDTRSRRAMTQIRDICQKNRGRYPPRSPLGQAFTYITNQWEYLTRFLDVIQLAPHNNLSERLLRIVALGRKNYLFVGHEQAGQNLAIFCSLIATCKLHDVNPERYLADVLIRVQHHPQSALHELLPHNWKARFDAS